MKGKSGKYVKRDVSTGKFVVSRSDGKTVTAGFKGVKATAASTRVAKAKVKDAYRYNSNIGFFLENDRDESVSAGSIKSKSQEVIKEKYKNI